MVTPPRPTVFPGLPTASRLGPLGVLAVDGAMALILMSVNVAIGLSSRVSSNPNNRLPEAWWEWVLLVLPPAGIILRRRAPLVGLGFTLAANMVVWGQGLPEFGVAIAVMLYSAVLYGPRPWNLRVPIGVATVLWLYTVWGWLSGIVDFYAVPVVAVLVGGGILTAINSATRQAYLAEVEHRIAQTERQRQADEDHVISQERSRIARELHDVVAHGLSLIVVQAGAAQRVLDRDPDAAKGALGQIEESARSALGEMRHVLGVLRSDDSDARKPTPTLVALDPLFDSYRRGGMVVTAQRSDDVTELPVTVDLGAYRIIEEALTNVYKHAGPGAEAHVQLGVDDGCLSVAVLDNGRGASAAGPADGSGFGLRGMRERVDVLGGSLRTGPRPGGGFEVHASLPIAAGAPAPAGGRAS